MFSSKSIAKITLFALAKAQTNPGDSERLRTGGGGNKSFDDTINGVNVDSFLAAYGDVHYDGTNANDDYLAAQYGDYNGALGEKPDYVYEEVGPSGNLDYFNGNPDYYDGGTQASSGRPGSSGASQNKSLNSGINKTSSEGVDGYNICRSCAGHTAAECQSANTFETCNDAQDACSVEVRSQYEDLVSGGRAIVHRYYSGCAPVTRCETERTRNFAANDKIRNKCHSTRMPFRFYNTSKCTFCTKLGKEDDPESILFGEDTTDFTITVDESGDRATSVSWADMFQDPDAEIGDLYNSNNWYSI